jgi:hypothetical protein
MEFYVLRSEKRQLETNIISGAADAFSRQPHRENKMRALPAIPSLGQANQGERPDQASLSGRSTLSYFPRHFVPGYSHWSPFLLRLAIP